MTAQNFSRPGAIDLSALRPSSAPAGPSTGPSAGPPPGSAGGSYSFDVTEDGFQTQVLEASAQHPVVLALWSSRAEQSRAAVDIISKVADSFGGRLSLARLDIDSSPQLAQALQVRAVPYVLAVLRGQPVPLFEGSVDEPTAREAMEQVLQAATANGITGVAGPVAEAGAEDLDLADAEDTEPVSDPRFAEAEAALERGDTDQAVAAYQRLVTASPADTEAATRLAQAQLVQRTSGVDPSAARAAAAADPADDEAQMLAADLDLLGGHADDAFDRIIDVVRRTAGPERDRARQHLVALFDVVGPDDPRVAGARRRLANALF
ncbi:MAG: tetratricopeptide repeat protein [Nocardioidaceae bacterium]|nr:tetratricopeptide repeat protein [Nocardioidaceae bacterium]